MSVDEDSEFTFDELLKNLTYITSDILERIGKGKDF
jgi:hypothetical protein